MCMFRRSSATFAKVPLLDASRMSPSSSALRLETLLFAGAGVAEAPPPYDARGHEDETDENEGDSGTTAHLTPPLPAVPSARRGDGRCGRAGCARPLPDRRSRPSS